MRLTYIEDFIVFARYMNVTRAAAELHMTQSNLSKRIKQLEAAVGCDLISHGDQLTLTPEGLIFLNEMTAWIAQYNNILSKIKKFNIDNLGSLKIRTPTWPDAGAAGVINLSNKFREWYPDVSLQFRFKQYQRPMEMIDSGEVDAHIVYEYGDLDHIVGQYKSSGFYAYPICTDRLAIWCTSDHELSSKKSLAISDLENCPILQITQLYRPLEKAVREMCSTQGFEPQLVDHSMNSFQEMLVAREKNAVHLFPYSLKDDMQLKSCEGMKLIPIEEHDSIYATLIMKEESADTTVELFHKFLQAYERKSTVPSKEKIAGVA